MIEEIKITVEHNHYDSIGEKAEKIEKQCFSVHFDTSYPNIPFEIFKANHKGMSPAQAVIFIVRNTLCKELGL